MSSTSSNTSLSLKFVIVGGGIAGLATAFTLKRAGHSVVVLEKRNDKTMSFSRVGGGIRAPPNMTKLLYRWGLGPILSKKALKCDRLVYVNANSGGLLGAIVPNEEFLKDLLADMILIQHGDLLNLLHDLALREGVEIRQNANVVYADPLCASVRLETGETVLGDLIVVADGCSSLLRSAVTGYPQESHIQASPRVLFVAFTVATKLLKDDESFKVALEPTHWLTWIAEDTIAHTYAMDGELLVGTLSREYYGKSQEGDEEWSDARDLQSYGLDFAALEPRLRRIFELSKTVASRTFLKRTMPGELVSDQLSAVLVGEAAHPLVCGGSHSTALVIEDAETLGSLFSRVQCRAQVGQLLMAYEGIRHLRCEQTHFHHQRLDTIMKYPVGPQQESRDAVLRQTLAYNDFDHMEAEWFQTTFGEHLTSFAYDAGEAVDDWWSKWGSFISADKDMPCQPASPALQVWISRE